MNKVIARVFDFAIHPKRALSNISFRMPAGSSSRRHIFIVGVPRSGTTLLKTILAAHPQICGSDNESTGIFGFRDIFDYAMGELSAEQVQIIIRQSRDIIQFYDHIVDCLLEQSGAVFFVDKLQVRSYRLTYIARYFPEAIFINIVRDGRDCYCSALNHPNVPQSGSLAKFARYWKATVALPAKIISPERLYTLRYEDLTSDPGTTIQKLMEFIELEYDPLQVTVDQYGSTTSIKKRDVHANIAKPISAHSQGRWQRELSVKENGRFCRVAGGQLIGFGYPCSP